MSKRAEEIAAQIAIVMPVIARRILLEFFQSVDIPQTQMFTIMALYAKEVCRLSDLAKEMEVAAPTITGIVDRLENAGYAARVPDPEDRRVINVELTRKGKNLAQKFRTTLTARWKEVLEELPGTDQEHFVRILNDIRGVI